MRPDEVDMLPTFLNKKIHTRFDNDNDVYFKIFTTCGLQNLFLYRIHVTHGLVTVQEGLKVYKAKKQDRENCD